MSDKVSWKPEHSHSVTPHLVIAGAGRAIEFYVEAFGAKELVRMPGPDGSIVHAELKIGDSSIMLAEECLQMGNKSATTLGGSPVTIHLYVEDADATFDRAVAAGATAAMPPTDMFWGDRYAQVVDPFGHRWSIATRIEDLSPRQLQKRASEFNAQHSAWPKDSHD
jgi:PhnB protein